jgi:hypothetical protein
MTDDAGYQSLLLPPGTCNPRAFGIAATTSQVGAALSPLLVVPIQVRYGWRASNFAIKALPQIWSLREECSLGAARSVADV